MKKELQVKIIVVELTNANIKRVVQWKGWDARDFANIY
jgi:hypothetical protein